MNITENREESDRRNTLRQDGGERVDGFRSSVVLPKEKNKANRIAQWLLAQFETSILRLSSE